MRMAILVLGSLWFATMVCALPATHVLEWDYTGRPDDTALLVERCVNRKTGCRFQPYATLDVSVRTYTDTAVQGQRSYGYRVTALNPVAGDTQSNAVYTP